MQAVAVPAPLSTQCLSPIGEELIRRGLDKEFQMDFVAARTRPSSVFSGHSFMVEAAIGYGGKLPPEGNAIILRFANRVPLMYQQGACAITSSISNVNWKSYNISQQGLPTGRFSSLSMLHRPMFPSPARARTRLPVFRRLKRRSCSHCRTSGVTSNSLYPGRDKNKVAEDRARAVCAIIPEIAEKVSEIVEKPLVDTTPIEGKLMHKLDRQEMDP